MTPEFLLGIDWTRTGGFELSTDRVRAEPGIRIQKGRDQARSFSPPMVGEASFVLDNRSRDYSPENEASQIADAVSTGAPVAIDALFESEISPLFRGRIDDFQLRSAPTERSAAFSCVDGLADLRQSKISTQVYEAIRTGDIIGVILDEAGWPQDRRDLDPGATIVPRWWLSDADAFSACVQAVNSEGPPAVLYVDGDGWIVFRDRHHRLLRTESQSSQATFRDSGAEPRFLMPLSYEAGWRDIANVAAFSVEDRFPSGSVADVWSTDRIYQLSAGETQLISVQSNDPFIQAITPVAGTDYVVQSGTVSVTLGRRSGVSTTVFVTATGGAAARISGMRLRAYPLAVTRTTQVQVSDSTSIAKNGRRTYPNDAGWANEYDAAAIAEIVLAHYAERRPTVRISLMGNDTRLTQQLTRRISDRITIVDTETCLDAEFHIEQIEHDISHAGRFHSTAFGCERALVQPTNVFRFDVDGQGFDDGRFGGIGQDDPANIFLFDVDGQGFDDGVFAH